MTLAHRLRTAIKRLRDAAFSKDKSHAINEAIPVMERAADALEAHCLAAREKPPAIDPDLAKLLAALGKGNKFPGRRYYINTPIEFDAAADALFAKTHFEEIVL